MVRAGRLQSLGGNVQPSIGAKKIIDQDEVVMVLLRETSTETVLSLPSFITASDMREVSEAKQRPIVHFVTELTNHQYNATFKSYREVLFFTAMALGWMPIFGRFLELRLFFLSAELTVDFRINRIE